MRLPETVETVIGPWTATHFLRVIENKAFACASGLLMQGKGESFSAQFCAHTLEAAAKALEPHHLTSLVALGAFAWSEATQENILANIPPWINHLMRTVTAAAIWLAPAAANHVFASETANAADLFILGISFLGGAKTIGQLLLRESAPAQKLPAPTPVSSSPSPLEQSAFSALKKYRVPLGSDPKAIKTSVRELKGIVDDLGNKILRQNPSLSPEKSRRQALKLARNVIAKMHHPDAGILLPNFEQAIGDNQGK